MVLTRLWLFDLWNKNETGSQPKFGPQISARKALAETVSNTEEPLARTVSKARKALAETVSNTEEPLARTVSKSGQAIISDESVSKLRRKALAETVSNQAESVSNEEKALAKPLAEFSLKRIYGGEKIFLFFVLEQCQSNGSRETSPISTEKIREVLDIEANHRRNLIWRLKDKQFVIVNEIQVRRKGARKFSLPDEVYQKLWDEQKALAKPLANDPSSSSRLYKDLLKTTSSEIENLLS